MTCVSFRTRQNLTRIEKISLIWETVHMHQTTLNVTETDSFEQRLTVENHSVPEQGCDWSSLLSLVPPMVFLFFTVSLGSDRLFDLLPHPKQPIKSNSLCSFVWSSLTLPRRRIRNTNSNTGKSRNREEWRIAKKEGERGKSF